MSGTLQVTARSLPPEDRRSAPEPPSGRGGGPDDGPGVPLAVLVLAIAVVLLIVTAVG